MSWLSLPLRRLCCRLRSWSSGPRWGRCWIASGRPTQADDRLEVQFRVGPRGPLMYQAGATHRFTTQSQANAGRVLETGLLQLTFVCWAVLTGVGIVALADDGGGGPPGPPPQCECTSSLPPTGNAPCGTCTGFTNLKIGCGVCCEGSFCTQTDAPGGGPLTMRFSRQRSAPWRQGA